MATRHVSETMFMLGLYGGLKLGNDRGVLVDVDLASSLTVANAAVDADVAKLHTAERLVGAKVKGSLASANQFLTNYVGGSSVAAYSALPTVAKYPGRTLVL